jgi:Holliday junction resolvase RusA-like endonuclease
MPGFPKVLPSEAYEEWERGALVECMMIKAKLREMGVELPILGLVSVEAHIYRERDTGDVCGYQQAIGDLLQAAEIIKDDRQIEDWDGTRRLKDSAAPRVEVFIRILSEVPAQGELL